MVVCKVVYEMVHRRNLVSPKLDELWLYPNEDRLFPLRLGTAC